MILSSRKNNATRTASASRTNSTSRSRNHKKTDRKGLTESAFARGVQTFMRLLYQGMRLSVFMLAVGALSFGLYKFVPYLNPEIKQVVVKGELVRLDKTLLLDRVREQVDSGLMMLDMASLQAELQSIPWAKNIYLVKQFPNTLELRVTEERALAQWNNSGYISFEGDFIESALFSDLSHLPQLSSERTGITNRHDQMSNEMAASIAMALYHRLSSVVLAEGRQIRTLHESMIGGWTMTWDNGLSIDLGRQDHLIRTKHAMATWQRLSDQVKENLDYIDARYENGVAIKMLNPADYAVSLNKL